MTDFLPGTPDPIPLPYPEYINHFARDCDVLLWEPTSWYGKIIARSTDGPFSHATACLRWNGEWMSAGFEEGKGAVVEPLSSVVDRYPGAVSVFRPILLEPGDLSPSDGPWDPTQRLAAIKHDMISGLVGKYQWRNIRLIVLTHLPLTKLFFPNWVKKRIEKATHGTAGGICSQWVARAFRGNRVQFLRKPVAVTTPNDLALSLKLNYLGTLFSEEGK